MNAQGGGPSIADVLRQLGKEALIAEAEAGGLRPRNMRMRCPFEGCRDKSERERTDTVSIHPGKRGEWRVKCHRCPGQGSLVDLIAAVRGWTEAEAIRHLMGMPPPALKPVRLVTPEPEPLAQANRLSHDEIRAVWERLATADEHGQAYLAARGLDEAPGLGLVRFATAGHPNKKVQGWAKRQRLVVGLMKDVTGNYRGLQARLVRAEVGDEPKISSLAGSTTSRAFFGFPELIESSAVVAIAEGLADTLALAQWCNGHGVAALGAAGRDNLPKIAEELERCAIPMEGRIVALFPQNDAPLNLSRARFERLAQLLHKMGARPVMVSTPADTKDLAQWLYSAPDTTWPPPALAEVLDGTPEAPAPQIIEPVRGSLPIPARISVESYEQDLASLTAILDEPHSREALFLRRGEIAINEMTGELEFAGKELDEGDITGIRIRILQQHKTLTGKRLKFSSQDIWDAMNYLAKRKRVHPVRDYLQGLKWDRTVRLEEWIAQAFGLEWPSLEAHLLRKWFISAAARGIQPGCKVDTVLILVGDEGINKTTLFQMLAGKEWFTSSTVQIGEADGYSVLRHNWIVEWGELDSMRRARDQQAIRNFLSGEHDFYRPKFAKKHERFYRSCVIVGTTNPEDFLQGEWNRRMWPVKVKTLDYHRIKEHRDQLWAEAAAIYAAAFECPDCKPLLPDRRCDAHKWWLEDDMVPVLRSYNLRFREHNDWVELIQDHIDEKRPKRVAVRKLLQEPIGKPPGQWHSSDRKKVVEALKILGWRSAPKNDRRFEGEIESWWLPPRGSDLFDHQADDPGDRDG